MFLGEDYQNRRQRSVKSTPVRGGTSNGSLLNGLAIGKKSTSISITPGRHTRTLRVELRAKHVNAHYYPVYTSPKPVHPDRRVHRWLGRKETSHSP